MNAWRDEFHDHDGLKGNISQTEFMVDTDHLGNVRTTLLSD